MKTTIPENLKGKELYKFLVENKSLLITEKKSAMKRADAFEMPRLYVNENGTIIKAAETIPDDATVIKVVNIINTTNYMDSHDDVHIPGLWKKSLSETKTMYLLQEHKMSFENIITDEVKPFTKNYGWKELGYDADGETQALVFESIIRRERNKFMFDQYKAGYVKNHSVGMNYVTIQLAINEEDEYYKDELAIWNKYIDNIVNREYAESKGYFWAVRDAKAIEGSAVPLGSNPITPTQSVQFIKSVITEDQPDESTEHQPSLFDLDIAIKEMKFF